MSAQPLLKHSQDCKMRNMILLLGEHEQAPLNHAHVCAPHCWSSGVDWLLHTINLTHEI